MNITGLCWILFVMTALINLPLQTFGLNRYTTAYTHVENLGVGSIIASY